MAHHLTRLIRFLFSSYFRRLQLGAFLLVVMLPGCSSVGDYLAGSSQPQDSSFSYPEQLFPIHIGATTKNEVRQILGEPLDVQVASLKGGMRESWAYPSQGEAINLAQFIPFFGALALPHEVNGPSFSVSFSDKGIVQGITLRDIQTYDQGAIPFQKDTNRSVKLYGQNNPLVYHSKIQPVE